jgi:hypothetical protein
MPISKLIEEQKFFLFIKARPVHSEEERFGVQTMLEGAQVFLLYFEMGCKIFLFELYRRNRIQGPKFAESYRQEKLAILGIFGDIGNFSDKETKIQILFNNEKNLK